MNNDMMGGQCSTNGVLQKHKILVVKPGKKRTLGRRERRWRDSWSTKIHA